MVAEEIGQGNEMSLFKIGQGNELTLRINNKIDQQRQENLHICVNIKNYSPENSLNF